MPVPETAYVEVNGRWVENRLQLLLCGGCGAVCFFCQECLSGRDKLPHSPINFMENLLIQVHDIHAALSNRNIPLPNENMVIMKEHSELVVGVGEWYLYALHLFFHNVSLVPDRESAFTRTRPNPLKRLPEYVTLSVPDKKLKINHREVTDMKESSYKSYDELPLFLNAETVAKVLGVSPSSGYELMHEDGFPTLKIGNRIVVPKEQFIRWVSEHTGGGA